MPSDRGPTAQRLGWLFAVVPAAAGQAEPAARGCRLFTMADVVRCAYPDLAPATAMIRVREFEQFLDGEGEVPADLARVAEVFRVPADYLHGSARIEDVREVERRLFAKAIQTCGASDARACRDRLIQRQDWRARTAASLTLMRLFPPSPSATGSGAARHGAQRPTGQRDAPHPRPSRQMGESRWHASPHAEPAYAMSAMSLDELRQLCRELVRELDLLPPLDPSLLCERLGTVRGRRIKLLAEELGGASSIGHLISYPHRDLIAYHRSAPRPQQAHVIYHEVIHLVRGHLDGHTMLTCGALLDEHAPAVSPAPPPSLYRDWQEWEAEAGATILSEMSRRRGSPRRISRDERQAERDIAAAFGLSAGGWP